MVKHKIIHIVLQPIYTAITMKSPEGVAASVEKIRGVYKFASD